MGDYLIQEIKRIEAKKGTPVTLLEIGAGDGELIGFLKAKLEGDGIHVVAVASDNGEWARRGIAGIGRDVEQISYENALEKYMLNIVLCSWMPPGVDFLKDIRKTASVDLYILIGPPFDTGSRDTWTVAQKEEVEDLSALQISRSMKIDCHQESKTFVLRLKNPA